MTSLRSARTLTCLRALHLIRDTLWAVNVRKCKTEAAHVSTHMPTWLEWFKRTCTAAQHGPLYRSKFHLTHGRQAVRKLTPATLSTLRFCLQGVATSGRRWLYIEAT